MNSATKLILIFGAVGVGAYVLLRRGAVTATATVSTNPTAAQQTASGPAPYVPPSQAIPTQNGYPSSAAPGASAWGYIPQPPTGAQQAASVISALGGLIGNVGNAYSDFTD